MKMNLDRAMIIRIAACGAAACLLLVAANRAAADQWFDLNDKALSVLDYDGQSLPTTIDALKQQFPAATRDEDRSNDEARIECYAVENLPTVNVARFYFCDRRLYQFEARFDQSRIVQQGGSQAFLNKLLKKWGPVDHAGESRWTWQRPMYSRRADYYAWPDSAQLTITDTAWMPVVAQRLTGKTIEPPNNLGF